MSKWGLLFHSERIYCQTCGEELKEGGRVTDRGSALCNSMDCILVVARGEVEKSPNGFSYHNVNFSGPREDLLSPWRLRTELINMGPKAKYQKPISLPVS